ncbi:MULTISPECIES: TatD family hydrolase [unclassified Rothia (in: high G+C Gram-positive bacteria)]|uniref:TatD family hydrolase n=1 Tax=unclassified Rothia (in: high G+C Gram-positive bacteria) TaxID=2689056 RepID=UPI00195E9E02|nr:MULTISPECIES: TatD family hydrolase [unclassified Rothia (in: high G+C Gram-positive bacteria)]MBM7051423.1 TatD family hydrolase [Rothia sp. ZJ1223]QRZ61218.1 TatD family hydrolase [Rothia sp. ZJ932]
MCTPENPCYTEEQLEQLAATFDLALPSDREIHSSIFTEPVTPEEGATPPAYEAEHYNVTDEESGEGTRRRSTDGDGGRKRNLVFPPAPEPLPHPIIDNHTHMDLLDGEVAISVKDALDTGAALGIESVVQVGCDVPSSIYAVKVASSEPRVLAAVALHPNEAPKLEATGQLEKALAAIDALAAHPRVRAVGETGLDFFRTRADGIDAQERSFREHIRIAKKYGKALQIHDRDAHDDVVRILLDEGAPEKVVFHCYSGDASLAERCNDNGWYMSFAGTVTFKNSHGIQESLKIAREDLILAETDAPFLTPHPYRGRPNASYMVNYTVRFMAQHRGDDLAALCAKIHENTQAVYGTWQ